MSPSPGAHPHTHSRRTPPLLSWGAWQRGALTGDHGLLSASVYHPVCDTKVCHWSTVWDMSESWFVQFGTGRSSWCRQVWYSLGPILHLPLLPRLRNRHNETAGDRTNTDTTVVRLVIGRPPSDSLFSPDARPRRISAGKRHHTKQNEAIPNSSYIAQTLVFMDCSRSNFIFSLENPYY